MSWHSLGWMYAGHNRGQNVASGVRTEAKGVVHKVIVVLCLVWLWLCGGATSVGSTRVALYGAIPQRCRQITLGATLTHSFRHSLLQIWYDLHNRPAVKSQYPDVAYPGESV